MVEDGQGGVRSAHKVNAEVYPFPIRPPKVVNGRQRMRNRKRGMNRYRQLFEELFVLFHNSSNVKELIVYPTPLARQIGSKK